MEHEEKTAQSDYEKLSNDLAGQVVQFFLKNLFWKSVLDVYDPSNSSKTFPEIFHLQY